VSGDPAEHEPYLVSLQARPAATSASTFPWRLLLLRWRQSGGSTAVNPYRAGKPLDEPFDGFYSARRGTYRIVYRIDEAKRLVEIYSVRHRRDAY